VVLVDRGDPGRDTLSTHALMRAGTLQLHRWGLLDRVVAAGTPPVRRMEFRYGAARTTVTLKPLGGVDALYAPRRTVLDPILVGAAHQAGADVRFGVSVTGVRRDADGRVAGIIGHDADGAPLEVAARFTVGADGRRSRVAEAVGAPEQQRMGSCAAVLYAHVPGFEGDAYEWCYAPGVTAGVIPTNGGTACITVSVPPERFRAELAADVRAGFRRALAEASPSVAERVLAAGEPERVRSFAGAPGFLRRPWGSGWALVGDAGHFKDPCTAHGMSDALRDAELLARALVEALGGTRPEPAALAEYHRTRDRLSGRLAAVTDAIASFRWDTTTIERLLRSLSAAMGDEVEHLAALDVPVGFGGPATARRAG
jgi:2-polyprenyl-6-methoxyphenol hydroxylase-like FAD-dependent oxidoreductase